MPLGLIRRVRLLAWLAPRLRPGGQRGDDQRPNDQRPEPDRPGQRQAGQRRGGQRRGGQRRGSHRRVRGLPVLTGVSPAVGTLEAGTLEPGTLEPGTLEPGALAADGLGTGEFGTGQHAGAAGTRPGASGRAKGRLAPPPPRVPGPQPPGDGAAARGPVVSSRPQPGVYDPAMFSRPQPDVRGPAVTPRAQPGVPAGNARAAVRSMYGGRDKAGTAQLRSATRQARAAASRPWYEQQSVNRAAPGMRDCGCIESILVREWAAGATPEPAAVAAINRLAELPQLIKERLAARLDAIHVGSGGVPDLDDMGGLKGVLLPSGRATWDACAGAYGDRKIIVGSRPSPTPDVMCHEIGHALDDLDGAQGHWQSDSAEFCGLYQRCMSRLASAFHRQGGPLGRREFFADSFAAIASGQRPALVGMLSGDTRAALDVMLYFNVRYGI